MLFRSVGQRLLALGPRDHVGGAPAEDGHVVDARRRRRLAASEAAHLVDLDVLPSSITSYDEWLQVCYAEARKNLTKNYGADESKWTWGAATPARFFHPLAQIPFIGKQFAVDPYPQDGSGFLLATPNVGVSVSMRHISEPDNWDATRFGIGLGQSGDPGSPHWKDQLADYRKVAPATFAFTPAGVAQATRTLTQLVPAQ